MLLSTWFGTGLIFPAPGFWGSLGTLPLGIFALYYGGVFLCVALCILLFITGLKTIPAFEKATDTHDSGLIVIDEAAGLMLALAFAEPSVLSIVLAFILFRVFDTVKPFPVNWCDKKLKGAPGVMMDDIVAGLYAGIALVILRYAGLG